MGRGAGTAFLERSLRSMLSAIEYAALAEDRAEARGWLQRLDPRVKLLGLMALLVAVVASRSLGVIGAVFALSIVCGVASRIPLGGMAAWVWMPVLFFTGAIALPSLVVVPGAPLFSLPHTGVAITQPGARSAAFLLARAETAATLSSLLVFSTQWAALLKSMRALGVPVVIVVVLGMTYRYIFSILRTACDMLESRRSRTVGTLEGAARRRIAAGTVGVLLGRSLQLAGDVHLAMLSRGFRGEVYSLRPLEMTAADWGWLALFFAAAAGALWMGR